MARTKGKTQVLGRLAFDRYAFRSRLGFKKLEVVVDPTSEMIVGVGCCVTLVKDLHIFIMAPDAERLAESLDELRISDEQRSHPDVSLVGIYSAREASEVKAEEERAIKWKEGLEIVWVYHPPSDIVCMIWKKDLGTDDFEELGPAVKKTEREARLLCRSAGWDLKDVKEVTVNHKDDPDQDIPF